MKIACIFGTRPEAIKMAPVVRELAAHPGMEPRVVVTAQHREMLDQVLGLFGIRPDHDLDLMRDNQTLEEITRAALAGLGAVFREDPPDRVLVHGDTTTTFCGALAAFYARIPVGHVEAGLRTGQRYAPFPEEINRKLTGSLADLHFAPTPTARENLLREGVPKETVHVTGNTVIDALLWTAARPFDLGSVPALGALDPSRRLVLLTFHRRESWGEKMERILGEIREMLRAHQGGLQLVFPVHPNPRVREPAERILGDQPGAILVEPLEYLPFVALMKRAHLVLTDSGGIQEEAPALGKPVIVLRDTTERPEAVAAGTVVVGGTDPAGIRREAESLLSDTERYRRMASAANPYGDGTAARQIVEVLHGRPGA